MAEFEVTFAMIAKTTQSTIPIAETMPTRVKFVFEMSEKIKVVAIVGPTASGKTKLGVEAAKKFNGEIISADSMQIYRGMNIATAKPTEEEKQGIPHWLTDFLPSDKTYSVADFVSDAASCIEDIVSRGKMPIIAGVCFRHLQGAAKVRHCHRRPVPYLQRVLCQKRN